jgi:hypothetical protein
VKQRYLACKCLGGTHHRTREAKEAQLPLPMKHSGKLFAGTDIKVKKTASKNIPINVHSYLFMTERTARMTEGRTDGRTDGRIAGRTDGRT